MDVRRYTQPGRPEARCIAHLLHMPLREKMIHIAHAHDRLAFDSSRVAVIDALSVSVLNMHIVNYLAIRDIVQ